MLRSIARRGPRRLHESRRSTSGDYARVRHVPKHSVRSIREEYLSFFEQHGHLRLPSASVVPASDPTLLFTNAGMAPFKGCFLGRETPQRDRIVTAQKCIRAGGKHNDLDNVGFTARHQTFFEMLGNFSFGGYFKEEAISLAWTFLTERLGLRKELLRVTVLRDDDHTAELWRKICGVSADNIIRCGPEDNFWSMGDGPGPCGPCTEIFCSMGNDRSESERWLEVWNLVFMQYERGADGSITSLARPCVDTGMGLERMASVLQGKPSNFDVDAMSMIVRAARDVIQQRTGRAPHYQPGGNDQQTIALKIIADHLRAVSFMAADGVVPANAGRGYVMRRILRRATRYAHMLGVNEPFLAAVYPALVASMGDAYPELEQRAQVVMSVLTEEETLFLRTIERGLGVLDTELKQLSGKEIPAALAFKLYDTYGFPLDLTTLIARERSLSVDTAGVETLMEQQRERARRSWQGSGDMRLPAEVLDWQAMDLRTTFTGYSTLTEPTAAVKAVSSADSKRECWVILDPCPFYAIGGGQVADKGKVSKTAKDGTTTTFSVTDVVPAYIGATAVKLAQVSPDGPSPAEALQPGDHVRAEADTEHRARVRVHHTATHLLHAALRSVLGNNATQAGSLVAETKLRFDFNYPTAVTPEQLESIERIVRTSAYNDIAVEREEMDTHEALAKGAMALFSEKYGARSRVVSVPGVSIELCGGTHADRTGHVTPFKILSEQSIAGGVRRIEAVAGPAAVAWYDEQYSTLRRVGFHLKAGATSEIEDKLQKLIQSRKDTEKVLGELRRRIARGPSVVPPLTGVYGNLRTPLHLHMFSSGDSVFGGDASMLRERLESLKERTPDAVHVLVCGAKVVVGVNTDVLSTVKATDVMSSIAAHCSARGGGSAALAQGTLPAEGAVNRSGEIMLNWLQRLAKDTH